MRSHSGGTEVCLQPKDSTHHVLQAPTFVQQSAIESAQNKGIASNKLI